MAVVVMAVVMVVAMAVVMAVVMAVRIFVAAAMAVGIWAARTSAAAGATSADRRTSVRLRGRASAAIGLSLSTRR